MLWKALVSYRTLKIRSFELYLKSGMTRRLKKKLYYAKRNQKWDAEVLWKMVKSSPLLDLETMKLAQACILEMLAVTTQNTGSTNLFNERFVSFPFPFS